MDGFSNEDREVKAYVRQSRVSPCVHVNPWIREPFRHKRRDNHFSLRFDSQQAL